jgi:hypothetical protein
VTVAASRSAPNDGYGDAGDDGGDAGGDARRARLLDASDAVVVARAFCRVLDIYSVGRFFVADILVWEEDALAPLHSLFITT